MNQANISIVASPGSSPALFLHKLWDGGETDVIKLNW